MAEVVQAHFGGGEEVRGPENFIHLGPPSRIIENKLGLSCANLS